MARNMLMVAVLWLLACTACTTARLRTVSLHDMCAVAAVPERDQIAVVGLRGEFLVGPMQATGDFAAQPLPTGERALSVHALPDGTFAVLAAAAGEAGGDAEGERALLRVLAADGWRGTSLLLGGLEPRRLGPEPSTPFEGFTCAWAPDGAGVAVALAGGRVAIATLGPRSAVETAVTGLAGASAATVVSAAPGLAVVALGARDRFVVLARSARGAFETRHSGTVPGTIRWLGLDDGGRYLALTTSAGLVRVVATDTGTTLYESPVEGGAGGADVTCAWRPDTASLVMARHGSLRLVDLADGARERSVRTKGGRLLGVVPTGAAAIVLRDRGTTGRFDIERVDLASGNTRSLGVQPHPVRTYAYSADGRWLVTGECGLYAAYVPVGVRVWSTREDH